MIEKRRRFGDRLRLFGYVVEVLFVAIFLLMRTLAEKSETIGDASEGGVSFVDVVLFAGMIFGALMVASGTFLRAKPPNAEELHDELLLQREEEREEAEARQRRSQA